MIILDNNKKWCVYVHINKINGKKYIGQTSQRPEKRWDNGRGYITSSKFYGAIQKYGWSNFEHVIIADNLSLEEANDLEILLIEKYQTQKDEFGYNLDSGGHNTTHSEETKRKISESNHIAQLGNKWSDEHRAKISEMFSGEGNPFYGHHHTEETKTKISNAMKGKYIGENHPFYGQHHSKESLEKISHHRQGKGGKRVRCINTGDIFDCMMDAARWCGLSNSTSIGQICNHVGKRKTAGKHPITHEKLQWEFVENDE